MTISQEPGTRGGGNSFGALVRAFRKQRGWTQQQLAERWGFTREYVSQIELGKRKLYGEQPVMRLAEILDIPRERLEAIGKHIPHAGSSVRQVAEDDDALLRALLEPARATVKLSWLVWYGNCDESVVNNLTDIVRRLETAVAGKEGRLRVPALELLGYAREMLGKVAFDKLDYPAALGHFQEMHDVGREINDPDLIALAMIHQGDLSRRRGRYTSASRSLDAAEPFARAGRAQVRGMRWQTLARLHSECRNKPAFLEAIENAQDSAEQLRPDTEGSGNDFTLVEVIQERAHGLTMLSEPEQALAIYEQMERKVRFRPLRDLGNFTIIKAQAYAHAGQLQEGVELAIQGLLLARSYDSPRHASRVQRMYDRLVVTPMRRSPHLGDLDDALKSG